uniref:Uncharacterized protein n=1 Tax=Caenorhabditis japonica TaxID=281687 RepID=A0A8R1EHR4_CAEJA
MEDHKKKMMALCETLELAKRVFLHQKREVLVVEEAYVNFRDGIKAVHTELLEMQEKEQYPGIVTSPIADDEPFGAGSSTGAGDHYQQSATSWGDNRAQIDMDIDDEDRPAASIMKPSLQALLGIASQPSLQSRIMQLGLKKIADGDEEMLQHSKVAAAAASQQRDAEKADFTRPPPAVFGAPAGAASNAFGVPIVSFFLLEKL